MKNDTILVTEDNNDYEIEYEAHKGSPQSPDCPGEDAWIEVASASVNGWPINLDRCTPRQIEDLARMVEDEVKPFEPRREDNLWP